MVELAQSRMTWMEKEVAQELGAWIIEGSAVKGWFTCEITGKKFRGQDAQDQLAKQAQAMDARQDELMKTVENDIAVEEQMDFELSDEVQDMAIKALKKAKRRKVKSLDEIQEKYPHVIDVREYTIEEHQWSTGRALSELPTGRMASKLIEKIEKEIIDGKRGFVFYEIQCCTCAKTRIIKPQDAFQVKQCETCKPNKRK